MSKIKQKKLDLQCRFCEEDEESFDYLILSCKRYDLQKRNAMKDPFKVAEIQI